MAFPGPPAQIVETHVSVIAMIGDRAYKLLKPVDLGFLDHRRREDRLAACRRETEVNRRFAPDVYLGVLDVVDADGAPRDHLVEMRRLPPERSLSRLLETPEREDLVREVARTVAGFHRASPTSERIREAGTPAALRGLWEEGLDALADRAPGVVAAHDVERARALAREYIAGRAPLLERRMADGWVRDGHGDILCDDVFCMPDGPRVLDCLAFDDRLRHGDVLADVAFLAMDLEARGHPELSRLLVDAWAAELDEAHPASLEHHHVAYRAHVRSKVAALRSVQGDPEAAGRARALHALALDRLERGRVRLVLVGGAPGTGKSTVAEGLARAEGWRVLGTDPIRREGAGPSPAGLDQGAYAPAAVAAVYEELLRRAGALLEMGESVVLDASWGREAERERARGLAGAHRAELAEIRCALDPEAAAARVAARAAAGGGASDATPEIARALAARADPWPAAHTLDTGGAPESVVAGARALLVASRLVRTPPGGSPDTRVDPRPYAR